MTAISRRRTPIAAWVMAVERCACCGTPPRCGGGSPDGRSLSTAATVPSMVPMPVLTWLVAATCPAANASPSSSRVNGPSSSIPLPMT